MTLARDRRSQPGIRVHRAHLERRDRTRRHGIPITSAARTILDYAEQTTFRELEQAFGEALYQRRTSKAQMRALLARSPGRRGVAPLRLLAGEDRPTARTRSRGEDVLLDLVRAGGLNPEVNVRVHGHELDLFFREQRLNVELDGGDAHRYRREADTLRDAELAAARIRVMRVSGHELRHRPQAVLARIARAL